jgi:hypothetical protein
MGEEDRHIHGSKFAILPAFFPVSREFGLDARYRALVLEPKCLLDIVKMGSGQFEIKLRSASQKAAPAGGGHGGGMDGMY